MNDKPLTPAEQVQRLYEDAENQSGALMETVVSSEGFAEILSMMTSNVMALTKMTTTALDQVLRTFRLAGRQDLSRLGRQLARNEDKLEHLLQVVERLEDQLDDISDGQVAASTIVAGSGGSSDLPSSPPRTSSRPPAKAAGKAVVSKPIEAPATKRTEGNRQRSGNQP